MVIFYGLALAYVSYVLGKRYTWRELVVPATAVSVALASLFAGVEMLSWVSPAVNSVYSALSHVVHGGSFYIGTAINDVFFTGDTEGRIRSVAFEPPALANFAGFAWPWLYAGFASAKRQNKAIYFILWALCTALVVVAMSRTSIVLLAGNILVLWLLRFVYLSPTPRDLTLIKAVSLILFMIVVSIFLALPFIAEPLTTKVMNGTSVSNISRLASMTAAIHMFFDRPVWGYGFGQYGFHTMDYLPSWGFYSWEIRMWFTNPYAVWPPVFSAYARFAAEMGLLGLTVWVGTWFYVAREVWRVTVAYQKLTGQLLLASYPLIMGCYCVLFAGIALDSLRTPMMWVTLGLGCAFLFDTKKRLKALNNPKAA
jgi:O-antigen ligase